MTGLFADWLESEGIDDIVDVLRVDENQFKKEPQIGTPLRVSWAQLGSLLATPTTGDAKGCIGGIAFGIYEGNHRKKANIQHVGVLVHDLDGHAPVDVIEDAFAGYRTYVCETFSSTPESPRCRVFAKLAEPIDSATYEAAHRFVRAKLHQAFGFDVDKGDAKDASRLSYLPVRRAGESYGFRATFGRALDARVLAELQREEQARAQRARAARRRPLPKTAAGSARYARGALTRAADAVASAPDGERHNTLNRECYSLARLDLSESEIESALIPAALHAMGDGAHREIERTIADAIRARRGSS